MLRVGIWTTLREVKKPSLKGFHKKWENYLHQQTTMGTLWGPLHVRWKGRFVWAKNTVVFSFTELRRGPCLYVSVDNEISIGRPASVKLFTLCVSVVVKVSVVPRWSFLVENVWRLNLKLRTRRCFSSHLNSLFWRDVKLQEQTSPCDSTEVEWPWGRDCRPDTHWYEHSWFGTNVLGRDFHRMKDRRERSVNKTTISIAFSSVRTLSPFSLIYVHYISP